MATKPVTNGFILEVPLDASKVEERKSDQAVQVLVQDEKGKLDGVRVIIDPKGHGTASFSFNAPPRSLRVMVGPADATPEEITGLQTISVAVPARQWTDQRVLKLKPIVISAYYWFWWLRWCRVFTITGRVLCPDGSSPIPGATVCAFDVGSILWWTSVQQIGCATTDINGAFTLKFRWCCGWWPWWWWRNRHWQLDPLLVERIRPILQRAEPNLPIRPSAQPALADLSRLLGDSALLTGAQTVEPTLLTGLRDKLVKRLPPLPDLHIWPWWPWHPWLDCAPDVIFQVKQECAGVINGNPIIVNETVLDTRWNIATTLDVTLLAGDNACCAPPPPMGCGDGNCMTPTFVCEGVIANIGGNLACPVADPALKGFQNPQAASIYSDRPYGGGVTISATTDCMDGIDYYEFEIAPLDPITNNPGAWATMPPLANGAFTRTYVRFLTAFPWVQFQYPTFAATSIDGHNVYETRQHYDATHPPADWIWIGASRDWLINWLTQNNFADDTYFLRAKGWNYDSGTNTLINGHILKLCGDGIENYVVVTVDNRLVTAGPDDAHGNPCTAVHACTDEPDTAIAEIRIRHSDNTLTPLVGCGNAHVAPGDKLEIDFVVHDHNGHLAQFTLDTHYDVNLTKNLLGLPGATLTPRFAGWGGVPPADVAKSDYLQAVGAGATRPIWNGGVFTLSVDATGPNGAFPYTCCYLLRLAAYKRTIVNCSYANNGHANASETSFTILIP